MTSFFSQLNQIETASTPSLTHNNPHATPTPVDVAAAYRLLQDQYSMLLQGSESPNSSLLELLISALDSSIADPPTKVEGVPQSYLDSLDRVPKKQLGEEESCPICAERFLDDEFPLVVELPCHKTHRFDLECVGPWLRLQGTCPLDRKELLKKKEVLIDSEDEEEYEGLYA
ncbi:hypothetical protein B7494_g1373 [Chlorociboria aeruginascens]|nr:hypothetical protein B7494_g1373 [Chlorociboria aeruginascens]